MKLIFYLSFLFIFLYGAALSADEQWSFYGDGLGSYDSKNIRESSKGSIWLSTDYGQSKTAFYKWSGLAPGSYKVSFYVKSTNVLKTKDQTSLWHFYDTGAGTQDIFRDLHGRYDWRKVEYVLNVPKGDLTIWFRLATAGEIWVDDFKIIKKTKNSAVHNLSLTVANPAAIKNSVKREQKIKNKENKTTILYTFDKDEFGHPFVRRSNRGEFLTQEFYNFKINNLPVKDWSDYDRLEMSVYNPNDGYVEFFITLADKGGHDYWSQLNHKQSLAPGWNHLSLSLTQFLGERGSHRYLRSLDLTSLQKFYLIIDPDKKHNYEKKKFLIDDIKLSSSRSPVVPKDVLFFNFTALKAPEISNYTKVTARDAYRKDLGHGFVDPVFWRVEDSVYASDLERYTIGLLSGHFRVDLPNGAYKIKLVMDKLGYWDVPFWSDRMIYANGSPIYKAVRSSASDFLNDYLRFESIIPNDDDNPYALYLNKVFETIEKDIVVKDGVLDLEFSGDASAISLNHLMIYNSKTQNLALKFNSELQKRNELEFSWMSRSISPAADKQKTNIMDVSLVEPSLRLSPVKLAPVTKEAIKWSGGKSEKVSQMIQLKAQDVTDEVLWKISDLKSKKSIIPAKSIELSKVIYQYTSPDLNHETYLLAGKFLVPLDNNKSSLGRKQNEYFFLSHKISPDQAPGLYTGEIVFEIAKKKHRVAIELLVSNYSLAPSLDFPVGFFGLDPISYTYFPNKDIEKVRHQFRMMALEKILDAGFTTFTGLPKEVGELDEIFNLTNKYNVEKVYSYGGEFPKNFMDASDTSDESARVAFYQSKSKELKTLLDNKNWPSIVYTFSDEASGYSDKIQQDLKTARELKTYFPFVKIGGFSSFHTAKVLDLNFLFDEAFYFNFPEKYEAQVKKSKQKWGLYNGSPGNLDDPRYSFGLGLYIARLKGLSHYLEWNSSAVLNYPYYDFDGREGDVVMFYPKSNYTLMNAIRFELAVEGLQTLKKLLLLKKLIAKNVNSKVATKAKSWLSEIEEEFVFDREKGLALNKKHNASKFNRSLQYHLEKMSNL